MTRMPGFSDDRSRCTHREDPEAESDKRYRLLCECLRDPFARVTMDGRIVECNALFCEMTGYTADELHRLTYRDLTPERWQPMEDAIVREQVLPRGHSDVYEKEYRRKDGTIIPVELRTVLERDGAERPRAMWAIVRDIGERKRAETVLHRTRRRLQVILESVPAAVVLIDAPSSRCSYMNRRALELYGRDYVGVHFDSYIAEVKPLRPDGSPFPVEELPASRSLRRGETVYGVEMTMRRGDGQSFPVAVSSTPLSDEQGDIEAAIVIFDDISDRRRAEEALRASEQRLRTLVDATSAVTWSCPPSGLQVEPQPSWMAFTGQTVEEMLGWGWNNAVHPDDAVAAAEQWQQAVATGKPFANALRIRRHDGEWRWMSVCAAPIRNAAGEIVEWIGMNLDITEETSAKQALLRSREGLRGLADASLAVMAQRDLGGMLQAIAEAALVLTQARFAACTHGQSDSASVLQRTAYAPDAGGFAVPAASAEVFPRTGTGNGAAAVEEAASSVSRAPGRAEAQSDRTLRGRLDVRIPGRDGSITVADKASGEFDAEDEALLRQLATVASLALQHVEARLSLEDSDRCKTEFLAMLGHELRNPLAPIRNSLYVLDRTAPDSEPALKARATIERQVMHLTRLVDDLLDVTRVSRGKIQLRRERFDLRGKLMRTVEDCRASFAKKQIGLELSLPEGALWLDADRTRIAQVIGNLLGNAVKFTPAGGRVAVSLACDREADQAILTVRDNGIGIVPEMVPRLFEPFAQAETTLDRGNGGLGLGLAMVKAIAELHGGSANAESGGPGTGAEFIVRLPLARADQPVAPPEPARSPARVHRRILVVEDNLDSADSLRMLLELCGHSVEVAHTGPEGVRKARLSAPDVLVCDIGLPEMDGYAVARTLRADPDLKAMQLVALSGYAAPEDVAKALDAGFDAHLAKPPSLEALEEILGAEEQGGNRR